MFPAIYVERDAIGALPQTAHREFEIGTIVVHRERATAAQADYIEKVQALLLSNFRVLTRTLKPRNLCAAYNMAEAVPFQDKTFTTGCQAMTDRGDGGIGETGT